MFCLSQCWPLDNKLGYLFVCFLRILAQLDTRYSWQQLPCWDVMHFGNLFRIVMTKHAEKTRVVTVMPVIRSRCYTKTIASAFKSFKVSHDSDAKLSVASVFTQLSSILTNVNKHFSGHKIEQITTKCFKNTSFHILETLHNFSFSTLFSFGVFIYLFTKQDFYGIGLCKEKNELKKPKIKGSA